MFERAILAGVVMLAVALPGGAQQGGDIEAQILYAFHTEDRHQLADLISGLQARSGAGRSDDSLRYHLAHAQYRLGRLLRAAHDAAPARDGAPARDADAAFSDCVDELKPARRANASAEAMALQSACYGELADSSRLEAVILRGRAADRLDAAYRLSPSNPRVNLLMAMNGLEHSPPGSAQHERAFAQLQRAAELFDRSPATAADAPGWGHAEAYLALGRELLLRGEFLGARNWVEKSLIAAPDFRAAQLQLAAIERR
ncbi:MAG: hypothetical protein WB440_11775 [Steroidobacteraceae bacterium]|jgi:tetratricopeptide (TPR) repeat protein